jgi:hypothetical protein
MVAGGFLMNPSVHPDDGTGRYMGYDRVRKLVNDFDVAMDSLAIKLSESSRIKPAFDSMREFLADQATMPEADWLAKWEPRFKEFWSAQYVVRVLAEAVVLLKDQRKPLRETLKKVFAGSLDPDYEPEASKDFFYELEVAVACKAAGFKVTLREPDLVIEGGGLSQPIAIACKYPSSRQQIHGHLSKGYRQIAKQGIAGLVCIGLDLIVFNEAGLKAFVDFRRSDRHPIEVLSRQLTSEMATLLEERPRDYPDERPIDGLLLTLKPYGIFGEPPQLTLMHSVNLQCDEDNPNIADIGVFYGRLHSIAAPTSKLNIGEF